MTVLNPKFNFNNHLQETIDHDESNNDHDSTSKDKDGEEVQSGKPKPPDYCELRMPQSQTPALQGWTTTPGREVSTGWKTWWANDLCSNLGFKCGMEGTLTPHPSLPTKKLNSICRSSIPILTSDHRLVVLMASQPRDDDWHTLNNKGSTTLEQARRECRILPKKLLHHCSQFSALHCGFLHGGGQKFPSNWRNTAKNAKVLKILNSCRPFK